MSNLNNDNLLSVEGKTVSAIVSESDCLIDKEEEPLFPDDEDMIVLDEVMGSPENDFEAQIDSELVELLKYSDEEVESSTNENTASEDLLILHASPPSGDMLEPMEIPKSKPHCTSIITEVEKTETCSAMSNDPSSNKHLSTTDLPSTKKENEAQESIPGGRKRLSGAQRKKLRKERAAALNEAEQLKCADKALNVSNSIAPIEMRSDVTTGKVKNNEENNLEITSGNSEEDCRVINSIKNVKQGNGKNEDLSLHVKLGKRSATDINNDIMSSSCKRTRKSGYYQTDCFIVTIVFTEYPVKLISQPQLKELHLLLLKKLDCIKPATKIFPKFDGLYYEEGACNIICLDEKSKLWLESIVSGLRLDGELLCVRHSKLSSYFEKVKAFFPGDFIPPGELLKKIKIQNDQLNISRWIILGTGQKKSGFSAFMKIPQSCFFKIKEQNNCLSFGTSSVKVFSLSIKKSQVRLETDTERKIQEVTVKTKRSDFKKSDNLKYYIRDWVPASEQAAESGSHWKKYTSEPHAQAPTGSQIEERSYSQENKRSGSHERHAVKLHQRKERSSKSRWDERPKSRWDIKPEHVSSQCAEDSVPKNDINFMSEGYPGKYKRDEVIPPSTQVSVFTTQRDDMPMEEGLQFQRVNPNFQEKIKFPSENQLHDSQWSTVASQREGKSTFEADKMFYIQKKHELVSKLPANEEHLSSYHYHKEPSPCSKCVNTSASDLYFPDRSHHQEMIKHYQTNSQWGDRSTIEPCDRYCFERKDVKIVDIRPEGDLYSSQYKSQYISQNDCNRFHFKKENISKRHGPLQENRPSSSCSDRSHFPERDIGFLHNTGDKDYRPHFQDRLLNVPLHKDDQDDRYFQSREMYVSQKKVDLDERSCILGRDMYLHKEYSSDEDRPHIQHESRSRYHESDRNIPQYKDASYSDECHHIQQSSRYSFQGREMGTEQFKGDSNFSKEDLHVMQDSRSHFQESDMYKLQHKGGSCFNKNHSHIQQERNYSLPERDIYKEDSNFNKDHFLIQQEGRSCLRKRDMYLPQRKEDSNSNKEHPHIQQECRCSLEKRNMYILQDKEDRFHHHHHIQQGRRYSSQERDMYILQHKEDSSFNKERPNIRQESRYSLEERNMYLLQDKEGVSFKKEHPHIKQGSRYSSQERDMYIPQHKENNSFNKERPHTQQESRFSLQERNMYIPRHEDDSSSSEERDHHHFQQDGRSRFKGRDVYISQHENHSSSSEERDHRHFQQDGRSRLKGRDLYISQHKEDTSSDIDHRRILQESRFHERTASYGHSSGVNKQQFASHRASSSDDRKRKPSSRRFNPDN